MSSRPPVRTAVVLGGSSEIAGAIVAQLAQRGLSRVVAAVRDADATLAVPPGVEVHPVVWDARDVEGHERLWDEAFAVLGQVDLVLCAVGMLGHHAGRSMGPSSIEEMVGVNFAGPAAALAVGAERLARQGSGRIAVLSSVAGVRPRRSNYVYGSSKSGLDAFSRGLGDALTGTGVSVLVVRPGFVRTRMTEGLDPAPFTSTAAQVARAVVARIESGRGGVLWVPRLLGPLFAVLGNVPAALWRRIAADR